MMPGAIRDHVLGYIRDGVTACVGALFGTFVITEPGTAVFHCRYC